MKKTLELVRKCLVMLENLPKRQQMDLSDFARNLFSNDFLLDITDLSRFAWNDYMDMSGYARNVLFCNGKTLGIYMLLHQSALYVDANHNGYTQVLISLKFQKVDSSDFAPQLWVRDLLKVPYTVTVSDEVEPILFASQANRSNQSPSCIKIIMGEQLAQGCYSVAWCRFEPTNIRLQGTEHIATPTRIILISERRQYTH